MCSSDWSSDVGSAHLDREFRTGPGSLSRFYTPAPNQSASAEGASGEGTAMIPISNVVDSRGTTASPSLSRYNGYAAVEIVGSQAPGHSSGEAMAVMQQIVDRKSTRLNSSH